MDAIQQQVRANLRRRLEQLLSLDWSDIDAIARSGVRVDRRRCIIAVLSADGYSQEEIGEAFEIRQEAVAYHIRTIRQACRIENGLHWILMEIGVF